MEGLITGYLYLDLVLFALSLFNMVLLLWLGGTVILNAERRTWGHALAGGGLVLAGLFFLAHTAIIGIMKEEVTAMRVPSSLIILTSSFLTWVVGWMFGLIAPIAWYLEMLWYGGFWDDRQSAIHRRHRLPLLVALLLLVILFAIPLLSADPSAELASLAENSLLPGAILLYPVYSLLCFGLSLDALRRPATSERMMGEVARRRARPWLVATALALLTASFLVLGTLVWLLNSSRFNVQGSTGEMVTFFEPGTLNSLAWLDVTIAGLVAVATLLLGQAVTSYEIFTGRALPRRGLARHWRSAIILAAGYSVVVGGSLALQMHLIYGLLLATSLMVAFYALFSWRSYVERERYIKHLRPFVASQRLYEDVLAGPPSTEYRVSSTEYQVRSTRYSVLDTHYYDAATPFQALCRDVLGARIAYLVAVGPLSPLVGSPLRYSDGSINLDGGSPQMPLTEIAAHLTSPQAMCVPVDPAMHGGAEWAVPLWSERGLIGILLLGDKRDGGLYTQEEIEIARASGERLIDTQASLAMAQRLMGLQRQRLAESQVLDRRARRVLHDDVLPLLHTTMLVLSSPQATSNGSQPDALALLADAHRQIADLLREMPSGSLLGGGSEVARLGLIDAIRKMVNEELGSAFDSITWQIEPDAEQEAQHIPQLAAEVLFYAAREAVRNAARHGRGPALPNSEDAARPLHLTVAISCCAELKVTIEDDGIGMDASRPPNEGDGSGQGLALHSTLMAVVGGTLSVESIPQRLTRVVLSLPR